MTEKEATLSYQSTISDSGVKKVKRKPFSQKILKILNRWYDDHINHPYMTKEDQIQLTHATGLSAKQLSVWFTNQRTRKRPKKSNNDQDLMKQMDMQDMQILP